jgi:arylsulfatase
MKSPARFLTTAPAALAALGLSLSPGLGSATDAAVDASPERPHVLLVTVDTLRPDFLGAYGFPRDTSPHFDALARDSVIFERAIAASSRTAPAHASMFTSRFVRGHSVGHRNGSTALADRATLASILRDAGFETAAFVSSTMLQKRIGLNHGFDVYDDELPDVELRRTVYERVAKRTTERALAWLRAPHTRPVFLWVHYNDPHGPYTPPLTEVERFAAPGQPGEPELAVLDKNRGWKGIPNYQALDGLDRPSQYRSRYAGEIRSFDAGLGRLLAGFRDLVGSGDAVVLITSDHGESFGEEGFWFCHGYATTPDLIRIPFLLKAPGLAAARSDELVHHVDVLPTLLDLVGLPGPEDMQGVALARHLRGGAPLASRVLFADVGSEVSAYSGDSFLRVRFKGDIGNVKAGSRTTFAWDGAGHWERREGSDSRLRTVLNYAAKRAPTAQAREVTPVEVERLKALGYLEAAE